MSSSVDRTTAYAEGVTAGEILAGPHVRATCLRHLRDLEHGAARGLAWDLEAADRIWRFFPKVLRLNGGEFEGEPFYLLDWQAFVLGSVFGWKQADGFRRFRVVYIETGKGSGKSPLAAGVGLYMTCADGEPRAECYAAATKKDQAKVLFRDAVAMVQYSPALQRRLVMSGGAEKNNITHFESHSFFRPIATEDRGKGQSGPRPHFAALDEIHEHPTDAMVEFMRAGIKGRQQPIIWMITNSGSDQESVCANYHDYASKVCSGAIEDDTFFGYVCGLDEGDDPLRDPTCWPKSNPSLGVTIKEKYLADQVAQALNMPSRQNIVLRLNFCVWTDASDAWIGREAWEACEREIDDAALRGRRCWSALDLSQKRDLTAAAFVFEPEEDGVYDAFVELWTPNDTIREREDRDRVPYSTWRDQGYLHAPAGKTIRLGHVAERVAELAEDLDLQSVGYDRWGIDSFRQECDDQGIDLPLVECGQGFKDMSGAIDAVEDVILNTRLRVRVNPVLRWNVASAVLEEDAAGNRKFTKRRATGRIDGAVALAMAIKLAFAGDDGGGGPISIPDGFEIPVA